MRITSKGQVTIPLAVREALGFLPHTEVKFRVDGDAAVLEKIAGRPGRGEEVVRRMRGAATLRLTTDEILALTREAGAIGRTRGRRDRQPQDAASRLRSRRAARSARSA